MSNRNYPTRMHQILGVEPNEAFMMQGKTGVKYRVSFCGRIEYRVMPDEGRWSEMANQEFLEDMINNGIIRLPRVTEEQLRELEALHTLGFRWLAKDEDGMLFAYEKKPEKCPSGRWDVFARTKAQAWFSKTLMISNFVSWSDPEPLDIVQMLRANGVEVEA